MMDSKLDEWTSRAYAMDSTDEAGDVILQLIAEVKRLQDIVFEYEADERERHRLCELDVT